MWLVWSRMLWLCRTPAPATALSRSPGGPPWCLQEPPACHQGRCNTIRTPTLAPVTWFLLAGEPLCGVLAPEPWPRWICCLATSCCWSASSRMKRLSKSVCVCWSGSSIPLLLTSPAPRCLWPRSPRSCRRCDPEEAPRRTTESRTRVCVSGEILAGCGRADTAAAGDRKPPPPLHCTGGTLPGIDWGLFYLVRSVGGGIGSELGETGGNHQQPSFWFPKLC